MTNLCTLPSIPVLKIMGFLAVDDILNLRLTCSRMLELSECETFFKRVNVKVHDLSLSDVMTFKNLCVKDKLLCWRYHFHISLHNRCEKNDHQRETLTPNMQ